METSTKNRLSNNQITRVIKRHFRDAEITKIRRYKEGTLNTIYLIEGTNTLRNGIILKIAPLESPHIPILEKNGLCTEAYVHQLLKGHDIPVPQMHAIDFTKSIIPYDYAIFEKVNGHLWSKKLLDLKFMFTNPPNLMRELGTLSANIQKIKGDWFGYIKDNERFRYTCWSDAFLSMITDLLEEAQKRRYVLPYQEIRSVVTENKKLLDKIVEPRLVNFDMWYGNIFLLKENKKYYISGIIDFERYFFGDPMVAFPSIVHTDISKEKEFLNAYRERLGMPLDLKKDERIRIVLYYIYSNLIEFVGTYRFNDIIGATYRLFLRLDIKKYLKRLSKENQNG